MSNVPTKTDEFLSFLSENQDRVWIFLDTETLGFNAEKHQLTEIAAKAVKFNDSFAIGEELGFYHEKAKLLSVTRLRLSMPFRGKGLSYRDLMSMSNYGEPPKTYRYIEEKKMIVGLLKFIDSFDNPILVAHNAPFDIKFLTKRHGIYFKNPNRLDKYEVIDTLKVMKRYFAPLVITEAKRFNHRWLAEADRQHITRMRKIHKELKKTTTSRMSLRLGKVAKACGLSVEGWHSADFDVEMLISTMKEMLKLFNDNRGKELYSEKYFS